MKLLTFSIKNIEKNAIWARAILTLHVDSVGEWTSSPRDTDENGNLVFFIPNEFISYKILSLIVVPISPGYWVTRCCNIQDGDPVYCERIADGVVSTWWLDSLGVDQNIKDRGRGVRIGVIDVAIRNHASLSHIKGINLAQRSNLNSLGWSHADAVCSVLTARGSLPVPSVAPGAEVFLYDAGNDDGTKLDSNWTFAAFYTLVFECEVDLICISSGIYDISRQAFEPGVAISDFSNNLDIALEYAAMNGCLTIAAAGNDPNAGVAAPANKRNCIAVGAVGKDEWGSPNSLAKWYSARSTYKSDSSTDLLRGLYHWHLSSFGKELDVLGPGVGVPMYLDGRPAYDLTGTSFAAPLVCGALSIALSQDEDYCRLERGPERASHARTVFERLRTDLNIPRELQGGGIFDLTKLNKD